MTPTLPESQAAGLARTDNARWSEEFDRLGRAITSRARKATVQRSKHSRCAWRATLKAVAGDITAV